MRRMSSVVWVLIGVGIASACSADASAPESCSDCEQGEAGDAGASGTGNSSHAGDAGATQETQAGSSMGGSDDAAAGQGGAGGAPTPVQWRFGTTCPQPEDGSFPTRCSFEATCEALGCGNGTSRYDENGCDRSCTSSADCGSGKRCRYLVLSADSCPTGSIIEGCSIEPDQQCFCAGSADCIQPDICVDETAYPPSLDCPVAEMDCAALHELAERLAVPPDPIEPASEKADAISTCQAAIATRQSDLNCPE